MPNRTRYRKVGMPPPIEGYNPLGAPDNNLEPVILLYEEFEAIRLVDYENLNQEEASERMGISRPTFTRLNDKARKKIAKAFVEGKAIQIKGGTFIADNFWYRCQNCKETMITLKPVKQCRKCDSNNIMQLNTGKRS